MNTSRQPFNPHLPPNPRCFGHFGGGIHASIQILQERNYQFGTIDGNNKYKVTCEKDKCKDGSVTQLFNPFEVRVDKVDTKDQGETCWTVSSSSRGGGLGGQEGAAAGAALSLVLAHSSVGVGCKPL